MRISDWSSDVCSSDLKSRRGADFSGDKCIASGIWRLCSAQSVGDGRALDRRRPYRHIRKFYRRRLRSRRGRSDRSEEHTSELQSLMRISYAVFCLKKKNIHQYTKRSSYQLALIYNNTISPTLPY